MIRKSSKTEEKKKKKDFSTSILLWLHALPPWKKRFSKQNKQNKKEAPFLHVMDGYMREVGSKSPASSVIWPSYQHTYTLSSPHSLLGENEGLRLEKKEEEEKNYSFLFWTETKRADSFLFFIHNNGKMEKIEGDESAETAGGGFVLKERTQIGVRFSFYSIFGSLVGYLFCTRTTTIT